MFALLSRIQIIMVRVLFIGINNITFRSNRLRVRIPVGAFGERDQLFGEVDHGVKEDHRQRTALDGQGIKVPGHRRRAVHLPANYSGEKKGLTSGKLAELACRFH